MFNHSEIDQFNSQGFIIAPGLASVETCQHMLAVVRDSIDPPLAPVEFETDVQNPGSPSDRLSPGGNTPRRLLHAYTRDQRPEHQHHRDLTPVVPLADNCLRAG